MVRKNEYSLFISKFFSVSKKRQAEFMTLVLDANGGVKDDMIDFLNYKPIVDHDRNITTGDYIKMKVDTSIYPRFNIDHYNKLNLVDDNNMVRVKVTDINPISGYILIEAFYGSLTIESKESIYAGHILKQEDLFEL